MCRRLSEGHYPRNEVGACEVHLMLYMFEIVRKGFETIICWARGGANYAAPVGHLSFRIKLFKFVLHGSLSAGRLRLRTRSRTLRVHPQNLSEARHCFLEVWSWDNRPASEKRGPASQRFDRTTSQRWDRYL